MCDPDLAGLLHSVDLGQEAGQTGQIQGQWSEMAECEEIGERGMWKILLIHKPKYWHF